MIQRIPASAVRRLLQARSEVALLDLRHEADYAKGHPLFAANLAFDRIALEAPVRLPRPDVPIILYGEDARLPEAVELFSSLGYSNIALLDRGTEGWTEAGYELFQDVNSYSKAFGELVESRRHTPSLPADDVAALIKERANIAILDARRPDEYATTNIPGSLSAPGAELVLRAEGMVDPDTMIIVNCAGRTRSIIGTQSLINAGIPNKVAALRNGTIGWTLAGQSLEHGADRHAVSGSPGVGRARARAVAYKAGVRHVPFEDLAYFSRDKERTVYRFDVRTADEYARGHLVGFRHYPGGQLVQETDMAAPVRGARILLSDDIGSRADMTASWLAQMGWDVVVIEGGFDSDLEVGPQLALPPLDPSHRYKRPYEGTDNALQAMQAYLDWEFGLVAQLERDATHGFFVI